MLEWRKEEREVRQEVQKRGKGRLGEEVDDQREK